MPYVWQTYLVSLAFICFLHFLIRELWWTCDWETSPYLRQFLSWTDLGCFFFFGCCCRHMGSLKSMRYGALIKAIYKFTMVRQNYGKWLLLLIHYCSCSWQYDWQLMGKQNEMWLFLDWICFHNAVIRHFLPSIVVLGMVTNSKINLCI